MLAEESEEEVFCPDIVVVEVPGFFDRILDDLFGTRCLREFAHGDHFWSGAYEAFDFEADLAEVDFEVFEDIGSDAAAFFDESEQNMLGPDVFVVEALCFLVGECHDFAGTICESFKHAFFSRPRVVFRVLFGGVCRRFVYPCS